jgi:hypothetical protein
MKKFHMEDREERNILQALNRGKADRTGGNCLVKHVIDER